MKRREFIASAALATFGTTACAKFRPRSAPITATSRRLTDELARIETGIGGRLGVAVHDTETDRRYLHRSAERFPMCSTFKLLACGAVLGKVDAGQERLDRRIRFGADDLVEYSPVTKERSGGDGMTVAELCEAAITRSDNTAGNLLLASIGGPKGVTAYARSLGDPVTRLDRTETSLNEAIPGDPRDTTTPAAMAANLRALVLRQALSPPSRDQLTTWLVANQTGDTRLRAGLPADWRVGDKTGAGERGTTNDIAVIWPPNHGPIILCAYLTGNTASSDERNAAIAAVARAVAVTLAA